MDEAVLRFATVLRERGVRLSVAEVADASRAVAAVGLRRRQPVRLALEAALVKDGRDLLVFDELFELFFRLRPVEPPEPAHSHDHAHDDLVDTGQLHDFTLSEAPSPEPQTGHSHDEPVDIREYFDEDDLASQSIAGRGEGDDRHQRSHTKNPAFIDPHRHTVVPGAAVAQPTVASRPGLTPHCLCRNSWTTARR